MNKSVWDSITIVDVDSERLKAAEVERDVRDMFDESPAECCTRMLREQLARDSDWATIFNSPMTGALIARAQNIVNREVIYLRSTALVDENFEAVVSADHARNRLDVPEEPEPEQRAPKRRQLPQSALDRAAAHVVADVKQALEGPAICGATITVAGGRSFMCEKAAGHTARFGTHHRGQGYEWA